MKRFIILASILATSLSLSAKDLPKLTLQKVAEGFTSPVVFEPVPDKSGRIIIGDQVGEAKVLNKDGTVADAKFLDLKSRLAKINEGRFDERGLLGLAFHPKYSKNSKIYVFYSAPLKEDAPEKWDHTSRVSEFKVNKKGALQVDHSSERIVLEIPQPSFNHNGGRIAFGPDGYLYLGIGDGGKANDRGIGHAEEGNGQNLQTLMGKILRIDVNTKKGYKVPADNPFAKNGKGLPEIYAYGIRNPWGISFDKGGSHRLFAADVGQSMFEEINIIEKGGNYGWRIREGLSGFNPDNPIKAPEKAPTKGADGSKLIDPIVHYRNLKGHNSNRYAKEIRGISVTGGYVYRGSIKALDGHYLFADWSRNWGLADGVVLAASPNGDKWDLSTLPIEELPKKNRLGAYAVAMGQDLDGEIYVLTNDTNSLRGNSGKIYKLIAK